MSYRDPGQLKRPRLDNNATPTPRVPNFSAPLNKPGQTTDGFKVPLFVKEKVEVSILSFHFLQDKPKSFSMDKEGRMIDDKGNIIQMNVRKNRVI